MSFKLGESTLQYNCKVEFYDKNQQVIAKVYQANQKIGECVLDGQVINPLAYESLSPINCLKIKELLDVKTEDSDDDELSDSAYPENIIEFRENKHIHAIATTVLSLDQHVKGGELIRIVHKIIQERYQELIDYVNLNKKERMPKIRNNILYIQKSEDWFLSLGGWKGMMPSKEVKNYHFNSENNSSQKFLGVKVYNNGAQFGIANVRIYIEKNCKEGFDLTYPQLAEVIGHCKEKYKMEDFEIAYLQLCLLSRKIPMLNKFENLQKADREQLMRSLDYFNSIMFGMEASGLNAGLAISLMTLDLIVSEEIGYGTALFANNEGGVYPYACFGNNQGTYANRETVLSVDISDPCSMKRFRKGSKHSPVAVKEAMIIKRWLKFEKIVSEKNNYLKQITRIKKAINDLIDFYFFPEKENDSFSHKKLRKNIFNE